ncbi:unnamed protein product [Orchesella dallaii]|uniref:Uncharacterized protein n=1 Tax=Orchesella dallaii TaxID=48710 RepID=A0ABP1PWJ3_9HEXA
MDLQSQLLNCEIEHLGQVFKVLSCELTVLQTFLKDKFGSDFEVFRESLLSQQKASSSSSSSKEFKRGGARKSNTKQRTPVVVQQQDGGDMEEENECESESDLEIGSESDDCDDYGNHRPPTKLVLTDTGLEDHPVGVAFYGNAKRKKLKYKHGSKQQGGEAEVVAVENTDEVELSRVKLEASEPGTSSQRKGGRQRKRIWEEFTKLENGSWMCNHCDKEFKCPQADRLEIHVKRCRPGGSKHSFFKEKGSTVPSVAKKCAPIPIGVGTMSSGGQLGSESDKKENESQSSSSRGRKLDPVWGYFDISTDPATGKKTAVCKTCQQTVYCKVDPIRKHFYACQEIDKEFTDAENNIDYSSS